MDPMFLCESPVNLHFCVKRKEPLRYVKSNPTPSCKRNLRPSVKPTQCQTYPTPLFSFATYAQPNTGWHWVSYMSLGRLCPWVSYFLGWAMSLDQLCPWVSYVPGWAMSLGQLCSWVSYVPGSATVCPWVSYVPGSAMFLGQLCPWVSYVPGSAMFLGQLCPWVSYAPGSAMSLGQLWP